MVNQQPQRIALGSWAKLTGFALGEEEVFYFVPEDEANYGENKIPPSSPLACALVGAKVGDKVVFHPPAGEVELTVLEVGPKRPRGRLP